MTLRSLVRQVYYSTGVRRAHIGVYRKVLSRSSGMIRNQAGVIIHADPADDRAALLLRARGNLDRHAIAAWRRLADELRPTVAIDVGTNYGEVAFSSRPPGLREVHLVEPNPGVLPWLRLTIDDASRKGFPAVVLHDGAASDTPGTALLRVTTGYSGTSSLGAPGDEGIPVRCFRLDDVIRLADDDTVLFKVDVEGHELAALRGMEGLLAGRRAVGICEYVFADDELVEYLCTRFAVHLVRGATEVAVDADGLRAAVAEGQRRGWTGISKDVVLRPRREQ